MLQVKSIKKEYRTGDLVQKALDGVSLNLRDNEFVAILGPSGSGKTTLLNIIGGLDRYDSGDLVINGISTKKYKDRDWDSYRNHTIGFVFQSYNLIMHQSVLSNVELALTISGISGSERRARAIKALEKVGLGQQIHKKPNQMSGGQMQRVAIARALVNDPDIVLADEPTGALDSETSVQVMDLLKEVAKDRLVVMVTHNPELAEEYATRIITIKDGKKIGDTDPFEIDESKSAPPVHKNLGRASMSFLTALSLSFNNLKTKKARTFMVSFAGSIGIIGIALILALSSGVNTYIKAQEATTLSEYPLQIEETGYDLSAFMSGSTSSLFGGSSKEKQRNVDDIGVRNIADTMFNGVSNNDLASLRTYLEGNETDIRQYVNSIEYTYNITPQIYKMEGDEPYQLNPNNLFASMSTGSMGLGSMMGGVMGTSIFSQLPSSDELYKGNYDVSAGHWPTNSHELVLVLSSSGKVSDIMLYQLGIKDRTVLEQEIKDFIETTGNTDGAQKNSEGDAESVGESVVSDEESEDASNETYQYDQFLGLTFRLVNNSSYFSYDSEYQIWTDKTENSDYVKELVKNGEELKIVGIVQPKEDAEVINLTPGIAYPTDLILDIIKTSGKSEAVKAQLADPETNIFNGKHFDEKSDSSDFDLSKLFQIDQDAIANAFQVNGSAGDLSQLQNQFSGNGMDLSGLDMSNFDFSGMDLGSMIDPNSFANMLPSGDGALEDALKNIKIEPTEEAEEELQNLLTDLISGYQDYAAANDLPTASDLGSDAAAYLIRPTTTQQLRELVQKTIDESGETILSSKEVEDLIVEIFSGYVPYLEKQFPEEQITTQMLVDNFRSYLSDAGNQDQINGLIKKVGERVQKVFTDEKIKAITDALAAGYQKEVDSGTAADPEKVMEGFTGYISSEEAQQIILDSAGKIIKTDELERSISDAVSTMMGSVVNALSSSIRSAVESIMGNVMTQLSATLQKAMSETMGSLGTNLQDLFKVDPNAFANAISTSFDAGEIQELISSMMSGTTASYDGNLAALGYADVKKPTSINLYSKNFDAKNEVVKIIDDYNSRMEDSGEEDKVITYTDVVSTMMSSVTSMINAISYVLIAFVGISLVVSSIMIGVITYISVLERRKEIGILRAIGASKHNIAQVFNAETFITGLLAGTIGVIVSEILIIPINLIIRAVTGNDGVRAVLPIPYALILILLSIVLTVIAGLMPSRKASKSDPVTALRTD